MRQSLPLWGSPPSGYFVASQLLTKYLNLLAPIDRGAYDQLPALALVILAVGALTRRERGSLTQGLYS